MMTASDVVCPKCHEWRTTLITEINDPMGKRFYCCCCSHEFDPKFCTRPPVSVDANKRDPLR